MTHEQMIRDYPKLSAAHKYILGYTEQGQVYYFFATWNEMKKYLKPDVCSSNRGGYRKVRVRVSASERKARIANGTAIRICDIAELSKTSYNKGLNFERVITEALTHTIWVKDSIPFYVQGDINLNGEEIQIKYDGAELTNEKTLANAKKILGK